MISFQSFCRIRPANLFGSNAGRMPSPALLPFADPLRPPNPSALPSPVPPQFAGPGPPSTAASDPDRLPCTGSPPAHSPCYPPPLVAVRPHPSVFRCIAALFPPSRLRRPGCTAQNPPNPIPPQLPPLHTRSREPIGCLGDKPLLHVHQFQLRKGVWIAMRLNKRNLGRRQLFLDHDRLIFRPGPEPPQPPRQFLKSRLSPSRSPAGVRPSGSPVTNTPKMTNDCRDGCPSRSRILPRGATTGVDLIRFRPPPPNTVRCLRLQLQNRQSETENGNGHILEKRNLIRCKIGIVVQNRRVQLVRFQRVLRFTMRTGGHNANYPLSRSLSRIRKNGTATTAFKSPKSRSAVRLKSIAWPSSARTSTQVKNWWKKKKKKESPVPDNRIVDVDLDRNRRREIANQRLDDPEHPSGGATGVLQQSDDCAEQRPATGLRCISEK